MASPLLSLCIPTCARVKLLPTALESALTEAATAPEGVVEVLVSDNGSVDGSADVIREFQARWPALRATRFETNRGYDANYLNCMEEARGEYVWIVGDDDAWAPGSVARMLQELAADPDAVLCAATECDMAMRPTGTRGWFDHPETAPRIWRLRNRADLAAYFDALRYQAGAFAFISVAVIRRRRFLASLENPDGYRQAHQETGYIHVAGMLPFLLAPAVLHWIPEPLILNRIGMDTTGAADPWARGILDLRGWVRIGERFLGDDPVLRNAFMGVLRRNHQDIMVRRMRMGAADDAGRWREARELLLKAGFDPVWVEAADFLYRMYILDIPMSPQLRPAGLCLADLPLAALGARRAALNIPGGLEGLLDAAGLLAALRDSGRFERILVVCAPGGADLLEGFEVLEADPIDFGRDRAFQEHCLARVQAFRPGLYVNADRGRGLQGDLLAARAQAPAALAFRGRSEGLGDALFKVLDRAYALRLEPDGASGTLAAALGLPDLGGRLWPSAPRREEAARILGEAGWDPAHTLAVVGDDPAFCADPGLPAALGRAVAAGATLLGVGGRTSYNRLDPLLEPFAEKAMNLGGALEPAALGALLGLCMGFLGGGTGAVLARCVARPGPA